MFILFTTTILLEYAAEEGAYWFPGVSLKARRIIVPLGPLGRLTVIYRRSSKPQRIPSAYDAPCDALYAQARLAPPISDDL